MSTGADSKGQMNLTLLEVLKVLLNIFPLLEAYSCFARCLFGCYEFQLKLLYRDLIIPAYLLLCSMLSTCHVAPVSPLSAMSKALEYDYILATVSNTSMVHAELKPVLCSSI